MKKIVGILITCLFLLTTVNVVAQEVPVAGNLNKVLSAAPKIALVDLANLLQTTRIGTVFTLEHGVYISAYSPIVMYMGSDSLEYFNIGVGTIYKPEDDKGTAMATFGLRIDNIVANVVSRSEWLTEHIKYPPIPKLDVGPSISYSAIDGWLFAINIGYDF